MKYLSDLAEEREALAVNMSTLIEAAALEKRDMSDTEKATYEDLEKRVSVLDARIEQFVNVNEQHDRYEDLMRRASSKREERAATVEHTAPLSVGEQFTSTQEYRSYDGRGRTSAVSVTGMLERRAAGQGPYGTADLGFGAKGRYVVDNPTVVTPLLDRIGYLPVAELSLDLIKWEFTNAAAKVAEKAAKPASAFARTITPVAVPTWAHYVELTRQLARTEATVAALINGDLRDGLLAKLEAEAGAKIAAATLPTATGPTLLAAIRKGMATVPVGYQANTVLLNPGDWADLDVSVMTTAHTGPDVRQSFWGMTPVASNDVVAGTAFVGDFNRCVKQFANQTTEVYMTDSDTGEDGKSNFKRNILTLLAECASLIEVVDARGMVKVTATPAGTTT